MRGINFFIAGLLFPVVVLGAKEGFLGVCPQHLSESMKKAIGVEHGVLITGVIDGSPADSAGIKAGDVILAIDGKEIENENEFSELIDAKPGEPVELTVLREGKEWKFKLKLGEKDEKEVEAEVPRELRKSSWGGGGGPIFLWIQPKFDEISDEIESVIGKEFDKNMWFKGGGGCVSIWKNVRIGGVGGGGVQIKSGNRRRTELSMGYGGFLGEYVIPLGKLQFFIGSIVGGGSIELRVSRSTGVSWQDIWNNFRSDSVNADMYELMLDCGFFHYQPYIGTQYPLTPWCYINLKGGYFGTLLGEWSEMGEPITSAPDMSLSNYCISVGVIFGYFTH